MVNIVEGTGQGISGMLTLVQMEPNGPVSIRGDIMGLSPGPHGFHVHAIGDTSLSCSAAAGHFNPEMVRNKEIVDTYCEGMIYVSKVDHGSPNGTMRHVGDLGNLMTPATGPTMVDITDAIITLEDGHENNILNRAFVIHADPDDLGLGGNDGSLATGNAGARLACGLIKEVKPCKC